MTFTLQNSTACKIALVNDFAEIECRRLFIYVWFFKIFMLKEQIE